MTSRGLQSKEGKTDKSQRVDEYSDGRIYGVSRGSEKGVFKSQVDREAYVPESFIKNVTLKLNIHSRVYFFVPISLKF